ncbi:MAG: hypothetical protein ACM3PT_11170 [Deltaproteobacteria bacterium]
MKFYYLFFLSAFLFTSCTKDNGIIEENYKEVPIEFIELKAKVDNIIHQNLSCIPLGMKLNIKWNKALKVNSHVEVEIDVKNGDNLIIPLRKMESGITKTGKFILKIDDFINPSELYIYGIIPDSRTWFINRKFKIDDIKESNFNGVFWVSDFKFKPFATFEYKNGKLNKKLLYVKKEESSDKIEKRDYWWCSHIALVSIYWENGEWVVCQNCEPIDEWYFDCEFIDEDPWNEDFDDCIRYPWLCEDDDGSHYGDDNGGGPDDGEDLICNCNNDVFSVNGFEHKWSTLGGLVISRHWLQVIEQDCKNGSYNGSTQRTIENPTIYQLVIEQNDAHELLKQPNYITNSNGKKIICGAHVTWSWNLVEYLRVGVADLASGTIYAHPQYMHLSFDVN